MHLDFKKGIKNNTIFPIVQKHLLFSYLILLIL